MIRSNRVVTAIIGVILMVAVTVILAAVIPTFALSIGEDVSGTGPVASIGVSDASDDFGR
jgi:flagellin-like protein